MELDSTSLRKIKENYKWIPHKDGILNREFFKWLGSYNKEDHMELILHLLNHLEEKHSSTYPKVTIKWTSKVLDECYPAK